MSSWDEYYYNEKLNKKEGKTIFHWFTLYFEMNKTTKVTLKEFHERLMEAYQEELAYYNIRISENNGKPVGKKPKKPPTLRTLYHYSEDYFWNDRIRSYQEFLRRKHDVESEAIFDNFINTDMKIIKNKQNELYELENHLNILKNNRVRNLDLENLNDRDTLETILNIEAKIIFLRKELQDMIIKCNYRGVSPSNVMFTGNVSASVDSGVDNSEKINELFDELKTLQKNEKDGNLKE